MGQSIPSISSETKVKLYSQAKPTRALCQRLFKETGANGFSFSRITEGGCRVELWTDANALEHSFFKFAA